MSKLWLIGGAAFLGILLIASIIVALTIDEDTLQEGTPEAIVQSFLKAVDADELQVAHSFLAEDLKQDCPVEEFFGDSFPRSHQLKDARITFEKTTMVNETAFVTVRISRFQGRGGLLGPSESSYEQQYTLRQQDGEWQFSQRYPWPFSRCPIRPIQPRIEPRIEPTPEPTSTPDPVRKEGE